MLSFSHRRIYNVSPDPLTLSLDNGSNEKIIVSDDEDDDDKKSDTQQEAESTMITSPCGTFDSEGLEYFDPGEDLMQGVVKNMIMFLRQFLSTLVLNQFYVI